jgi:hypothetical protein
VVVVAARRERSEPSADEFIGFARTIMILLELIPPAVSYCFAINFPLLRKPLKTTAHTNKKTFARKSSEEKSRVEWCGSTLKRGGISGILSEEGKMRLLAK